MHENLKLGTIIFDPKKNTFPRLSSSVKASPRCRKSDALSMQHGHIYICMLDDMIDEVYVHTILSYWYDWWYLCTSTFDEEWCEDSMYWTIQHCKTISKSIEILQCSISYYYYSLYKNMLHDSMTQKLRKKTWRIKKNVCRVAVSHIFSHLFLLWNVHTCFVALFRYIHLRSFPTVSLWGIHQLRTVPFMETAPRVVNG